MTTTTAMVGTETLTTRALAGIRNGMTKTTGAMVIVATITTTVIEVAIALEEVTVAGTTSESSDHPMTTAPTQSATMAPTSDRSLMREAATTVAMRKARNHEKTPMVATASGAVAVAVVVTTGSARGPSKVDTASTVVEEVATVGVVVASAVDVVVVTQTEVVVLEQVVAGKLSLPRAPIKSR